MTPKTPKHSGDSSEEERLDDFFFRQLSQWDEVRMRYESLKHVKTKRLGWLTLQHNPARIISTAAKLDSVSLARRLCPLCEENRPKRQMKRRINDDFCMLVNPFPILPKHFTIVASHHEPQAVLAHYEVIPELLRLYKDLVVFYNGPKSGASVPDHLHLQAGESGQLPLQHEWHRLQSKLKPLVVLEDKSTLSVLTDEIVPMFVVRSVSGRSSQVLFRRVYKQLPLHHDEAEPRLNIVAWRDGETYVSVIIPRGKHRPACYYDEGEAQLLVSPGALDMAGLVIVPREKDFNKLSEKQAVALLKACGVSEKTMNEVSEKIRNDI